MKEPVLTEPWLVAAWPGMGSVALAAGSYLVAKLGAREVVTLVKREFFDINTVAIEAGLVRRPLQPKSTLYAAPAPGPGGRDLLLFLGEAQPSTKGYEFCHEIVDLALARGTKRIVTFAAMATPIRPADEPRVFGVASESGLLDLLRDNKVGVLNEGQISGLNGVLLAAAAERGVEAICLLGELPFFAVGIPNPKASLAVLRAFGRISGVNVDSADLEEQARVVERGLSDLLERASKQVEGRPGESEDEKPGFEVSVSDQGEVEVEPPLPPETLKRIEELFRRATSDKTGAIPLKAELDKLGIFKKYEDRFLDLFKRDEHG